MQNFKSLFDAYDCVRAGPYALTVGGDACTTSAAWKFAVVDDSIEVYRNGRLFLSYQNPSLVGGSGKFDAIFRLNNSNATTDRSGTVKLSEVKLFREETEEDGGVYHVTGIPASGTVTNVGDRSPLIEIVSTKGGLARKIRESISFTDGSGNDLEHLLRYSDKSISVPIGLLSSQTSYSLRFAPLGYEAYETTFTTGNIADVQDVAYGLLPVKTSENGVTRYVLDLKYSYDLDSISVSGTDVAGAEVLLSRDAALTTAKMTSLGEISASGANITIAGDGIGRYRYIVLQKSGDFTVTGVTAGICRSSLSGERLKERTVGGASVDMRFGSMSDLHNTSRTDNTVLDAAFDGFDAIGKGLDAMTLVGDIVYWAPNTTKDEAEESATLKDRYQVISDALNAHGFNNKQNDLTTGKDTIWVIGNHEYAESYSDYNVREEKTAAMVNECIGYEDIHTTVNGYHFIGAALSSGLTITPAKAAWIEEQIETAEADDPEKPIFVFTHVPTPNTNFATYTKDQEPQRNYWPGTEEFLTNLKNKHQVIVVSGHTHFPAQYPENITQVGYTQVLTGVIGGGYLHRMVATENLNDSFITDYHSQGLLFEVKNNVVYIYRVDLTDQAVIGEPWVVDTEGLVNGSEEERYTDQRYASANAPYFEAGAAEQVVTAKNGNALSVTFPQAKVNATSDDGFVPAYEIHVKYNKGNALISTSSDYSDFYLTNTENPQSATATISVPYPEILNGHDCTVEIYAVSPYQRYSDPIEKVIPALHPDAGLTADELAKPLPVANVLSCDFDRGTITDSANSVVPSVTGTESLIALPHGEKYHFFNGTNALSYSVSSVPQGEYTLETIFNSPMVQRKQAAGSVEHRLIGTAAHNLSLDEQSRLIFHYTAGGVAGTLSSAIPHNLWLHAAATLSADKACLYIDGQLIAEETISEPADAFDTTVLLGANSFVSMLKGRVFDHAASAGEIFKLVRETAVPLCGDLKAGAIKLLSQGKTVTTLDGSYDATSGLPQTLVDGNTNSYVYLNSNNADIEIDLGRLYDLKSFVLFTTRHWANHRYDLKIQVSAEQESNSANRTTVTTIASGTAMSADGMDMFDVPLYCTVPDGTQPVRYVYLSRYTTSFGLILAEIQAYGKALDEEADNRIDLVDSTGETVSSVTLATGASAPSTCTVFVAKYLEATGELVSVVKQDCVLARDGRQQTIVLDHAMSKEAGCTIKVMVWYPNNVLNPLTDYYRIVN